MCTTRNHGLVIFQPFWGLKDVVTFAWDVCHDVQLTYINSLKAFQHFDAMEELQQQIEAAETQAALARSAMQMVTATTQQGLSKDEGFFCWLQRAKLVGDIVGTSLLEKLPRKESHSFLLRFIQVHLTAHYISFLRSKHVCFRQSSDGLEVAAERDPA